MATYLENIAAWFRQKLDGPGGMATAEDARLGLRVLTIWRARLIAQSLRELGGGKVLSGPFEGMAYLDVATEGALAPRLLGSYEDELHPYLRAMVADGIDCVIDVGCAEGYYAVGLARMAPQAEIFAYDIAPKAQEACKAMAALNGVADRVKVGGEFQPTDFEAFAGRKVLVIMDVEGAEAELLRPDLSPALASMRLIVETHDLYVKGALETVRSRFEATHDIVRVDPGPKTLPLPDKLRNQSHLDQLLAVWEFRAAPTPWLVMTPKG